MIRNYIKIAWRNVLKNKAIYSINIIGLSFGIATCLLISMFVIEEFSFDRYNENADNIVRVVLNAKINGEEMKEAVSMAPIKHTFKKDLPEVIDATRLTNLYNPKLTYKNVTYRNSKFAYVDPNFFEIFTLPIIKGNSKTPLSEPNTIVLTETEAQKYFGNEDPIGKQLTLERTEDIKFTVTGIIKEVPENSHFHFGLFASTTGFDKAQSTSWTESEFYNYLLLKNGTDATALEKKIPALIDRYMGPQIKAAIGIPYSEFKRDNKINLLLQPLTDIHLRSDFIGTSQLGAGGDIKTVYIFIAIALFMLIIACINFINLSTAAASKRAKEVGIRKVLGSDRKRLIYQFVVESLLATVIAVGIGIVIFIVALPVFNELSGKQLEISNLLGPKIILLIIAFIVFIPFLAGGYPAFFLSSFTPIKALKNRFSGLGGSKGIRGGLVVFQFVISAVLIVATIVVEQQMQFIQNKKLGYDKDQMLILSNAYLLGDNIQSLKNELLTNPQVESVSQSAYSPAGESDTSMSGIYLDDQYIRRMFTYDIDEQYIPTMGMQLLSGRNFSKDFGIENDKAIINEAAAQALGFGDDPLEKVFYRDTNNGKQKLTVIGVIKDFHYKSLKEDIEPLIMLNNLYGGLIIRSKGRDIAGIIENANAAWLTYGSKEPFEYFILDDAYNNIYISEKKIGNTLSIFALLTIFVACLGLFGLVTYTAEQRIKEIGIRKVLGSSVAQIVALLSIDFLKLVVISFLIAFPLAYYLMNTWLQDFAYRITLSPWVFVLAGATTLIIAFFTVSFKSIQAATVNPVNSLHAE